MLITYLFIVHNAHFLNRKQHLRLLKAKVLLIVIQDYAASALKAFGDKPTLVVNTDENVEAFRYPTCWATFFMESHKNRYTAGPDSIALLDCRTPHRYYCQDSVDFMWFHFCGNHSGAYADYLFEQHGVVFPPGHGETSRFQHIFSSVQSVSFSEHLVSADIHALLSSLAVSRQHHQAHHQPLLPAIDYIRTHFDQPVSLEDLADQCSMSTSHLIRSFQRYLNCTPHEYLLAFRLKQSKQLLLSTSMSIEQIAEQCGFNSASHFARAFRKNNGASPSTFRQVHF